MGINWRCPDLTEKMDSRNYRLVCLLLICSQLGFEPLSKMAGVTGGQGGLLRVIGQIDLISIINRLVHGGIAIQIVYLILAKHLTEFFRISDGQDEE